MIIRDAKARKEKRLAEERTTEAASQQWLDHIEERIGVHLEDTMDFLGGEFGALEARLHKKIADLKDLCRTNHDALYQRVRRFEAEYDGYVATNRKHRATVIAPPQLRTIIQAAIEEAIKPLEEELEILRREHRTGEVIDLPNPLVRRA